MRDPQLQRKGAYIPLNWRIEPLSRRKNRALAQVVDNTVNFSAYLQQQQQQSRERRSVQLAPKTANQQQYVDLLLDESIDALDDTLGATVSFFFSILKFSYSNPDDFFVF